HSLHTKMTPCAGHSFLSYHPSTPRTSTLSLHDALPIWPTRRAEVLVDPHERWPGRTPATRGRRRAASPCARSARLTHRHRTRTRSEEHTSELQSRFDLVCRLLL